MTDAEALRGEGEAHKCQVPVPEKASEWQPTWVCVECGRLWNICAVFRRPERG